METHDELNERVRREQWLAARLRLATERLEGARRERWFALTISVLIRHSFVLESGRQPRPGPESEIPRSGGVHRGAYHRPRARPALWPARPANRPDRPDPTGRRLPCLDPRQSPAPGRPPHRLGPARSGASAAAGGPGHRPPRPARRGSREELG